MGWMKALVLSVCAGVIIAVLPGCPSENGTENGTCEGTFSDIEGYQLCEDTEQSCIFYRSDQENPEISCGVICVSKGEFCLSAHNEGEPNVCADLGAEVPCNEPQGNAVCECGRQRTLADRCAQSDEFYCGNGYRCRDEGWAVSAEVFEQLYGQNEEECLMTGTPCTTEEAYCGERGFSGTYNEANHEACISGQSPETWNCPVDESGLPVFPPECDQICVAGDLGGLGDSCEGTDDCDPSASDLGVFCCLQDAATCENNLGECVEDCSQYSSGGEVGMFEGALCEDNNECGVGLFCCLVPDAAGNCDFDRDQSCTCRSSP